MIKLLFKLCLNFLLIVFIFSCGSSFNKLDGDWAGSSTSVSINVEENSFKFDNKLKPNENFNEKIVSFEKNLEGKWEIKLTHDKSITLKTFNDDTIFIYTKNGYLRLKKRIDN
tara:strand:+ start:105 stop:443 length:339 start_codon:yes stop_codon:yes gene_type:complete